MAGFGAPPEKKRRTDGIDDWGDDESDEFFFSQCASVLDHVEASQNVAAIEKNNNKANDVKKNTYYSNPTLSIPKQTNSLQSNKSQGYHSMVTPSNKLSGNLSKPPISGIFSGTQKPNTNTTFSLSGLLPSANKQQDTTNTTNSTFSNVLNEKLTQVENEKDKLLAENKKLKEGQYSKDGQIKILRTKVVQLETERHKEKQNKMLQKEAESKEQNIKHQQLLKEFEKLKTSLKFKEKDCKDLQDKVKSLEKQCKSQEINNASPRRTQLLTSPARSPRVIMVRSPCKANTFKNNQVSPSNAKDFPTTQTFNEHVSPKKVKSLNPQFEDVIVKVEHGTSSVIPTTKKKATKMKLEMPYNFEEEISGPQLISRLFDDNTHCSKSTSSSPTPSLIGLLQNSVPIVVKREKESTAVTISSSSRSSSKSTCSSVYSDLQDKFSVSKERIALAQQAVSELLNSPDTSATKPASLFSPDSDFLSSNSRMAVKLLPLLDSYLNLYIQVLESSNDLSSESQSNSEYTSASSIATSLSSFKSAFGVSASICSFEKQAASALQVVEKLMDYCKYMSLLISSGKELILQEPIATVKSAFTYADKHSSRKTQLCPTEIVSLHINDLDSETINILKSCDVLPKLIKLANPSVFHNEAIRIHICIASLRLLTRLASTCNVENFRRFNNLFNNECLLNCLHDVDLNAENHLVLATHTLSLISALVKSPVFITQLCTQDDQCLLLHIYNLSLVTAEAASQPYRLAYSHQLFLLLNKMLMMCSNGAQLMFEGECRCCSFVVKTVTVSLYRELCDFNNTPEIQAFIRTALSTLFLISTKDRLFTRHHEKECEHEFIETVCTLYRILPSFPDFADLEMNLVFDLWDFDQEVEDQSGEDMEEDDNQS